MVTFKKKSKIIKNVRIFQSLLTLHNFVIKRPWLDKLGNEMPLWYPGSIFESDGDFRRDFLEEYYKLELMEEFELPPILVDNETALNVKTNQSHGKRSEIEPCLKDVSNQRHQMNGIRRKMPNQSGIVPKTLKIGSSQSEVSLPRTIFEETLENIPKQRDSPGSRYSTEVVNAALKFAYANLHPVPIQQIAEPRVLEWSPTEEIILLNCIKSSMRSRFHRNPFESSINWSLVSDVVNTVSHCNRSDEQCRYTLSYLFHKKGITP